MRGNATVMARSATLGRALGRRHFLGTAASLVALASLDCAALAVPRAERRLALYNPHTDERFDDVYWCDGTYVPDQLDHIDWLMRDFHRDQATKIDPSLLDLLHRLAERLETQRPFRILSAYRTAATNRQLRREGFAPAAHSEHLLGKAADIRIDGVRVKHLRRAALSLEAGGVGTYWHEEFVHVDVGPVRSW